MGGERRLSHVPEPKARCKLRLQLRLNNRLVHRMSLPQLAPLDTNVLLKRLSPRFTFVSCRF